MASCGQQIADATCGVDVRRKIVTVLEAQALRDTNSQRVSRNLIRSNETAHDAGKLMTTILAGL